MEKTFNIKKLRPVFNKFKSSTRPVLATARILGNTTTLFDAETAITFFSNFGLSAPGCYDVKSFGLLNHPTMDINEYPEIAWDSNSLIDGSVDINLQDLEYLLPFASKDGTRLHLNSIAIDNGHLVATDGHCLRFKKLDNLAIENNYILPATSLHILVKLLKKFKIKTVQIKFSTDKKHAYVYTEFFNWRCLLINRDYIRWQSALPNATDYNTTWKIANWINFNDLKSAFNDRRSYKMKLKIVNQELYLIINEGTVQEISKPVGRVVNTSENKIKSISINAAYLDKSLKNNFTMELSIKNSLSPIRAGDTIVMPLKP